MLLRMNTETKSNHEKALYHFIEVGGFCLPESFWKQFRSIRIQITVRTRYKNQHLLKENTMTTKTSVAETIDLASIPFTEAMGIRELLFAEPEMEKVTFTRQLPISISDLSATERVSLSHALGIYEEVGVNA
jgi:hypothetical protein